MPLGVDIVEPPMVAALEAEGITVRDAQQVMLDAREVKSIDEIMLLNTACSMVDGAYQMLAEQLKPGVRESELVAERHASSCSTSGSEHVDNINAVSGERCSPHPHVFSDRIIRPGDQAFFDIIHTFVGYKTCYYRTFVVGQRDATPSATPTSGRASGSTPRSSSCGPGVGTDQVAQVWPKAEEFGFANEMECFGLQFGHSVGLFLHERPIISRLNSLDHPVELKEGMVIALETYCPAKDGYSAARIEEEVVITADGPQVITKFPSQELFVANAVLRSLMATSRAAAPAADLETRSRCTARWSSAAGSRPAPRSCSSRASSAGRRTSASGQEAVAAGFGVAMRVGRLDVRAPIAATTTRWPAARRWAGLYAELFGRAGRPDGRQGRLDAHHQRRAPHDGQLRDRRRPPADRARRRVVRPVPRARSRSRCASSATGRRTSARSTRRSTWPPCGRRRSCSCARTTATWSTRAIGSVTAVARPGGGPGGGLRPGADRRRRQRRGRRVRGRHARRWPGRGPARGRR